MFDSFRLTVPRVRSRIIKDKDMGKAGGIVLLLPGNVQMRSGLIGLDVTDELFDRLLNFFDGFKPNLIGCDLVNWHMNSLFLSTIQNQSECILPKFHLCESIIMVVFININHNDGFRLD